MDNKSNLPFEVVFKKSLKLFYTPFGLIFFSIGVLFLLATGITSLYVPRRMFLSLIALPIMGGIFTILGSAFIYSGYKKAKKFLIIDQNGEETEGTVLFCNQIIL